MMAPNMATPMMKPTPEAELNVRLRKSASGMTGSVDLVSTTQKATSSTTLTRANPRIGAEPHRYCVPPHVVMRMMAVTPADRREIPAQSILWCTRLVGRWSTAAMTNRATMPMGTLM